MPKMFILKIRNVILQQYVDVLLNQEMLMVGLFGVFVNKKVLQKGSKKASTFNTQ